jgi:hypothetical protein
MVVVAFAGTEPTSLVDWVTDFSALRHPSDASHGQIHEGFEAGVQRVWDQITAAVGSLPKDGRLYVTGHSLGAALAGVAGYRLRTEAPPLAAADRISIYTFGMPRVGDAGFAEAFAAAGLDARTYRFVHGLDMVTHVPPFEPPFNYRHVGQLYACAAGTRFVLDRPLATGEPAAGPSGMAHAGAALLQRVLQPARLPPYPRRDWVGEIADALPPLIRDHLPDRYMYALSVSPMDGPG